MVDAFAWCLSKRENEGGRDDDERFPEFREIFTAVMDDEENWFQGMPIGEF